LEALMADRDRVVIIGAGHNGLVAAFYLAKAGLAPLVLESRGVVGGAAITEEICPGFRCSSLFDMSGPLLPDVEKDLDLKRHGLQTITPDVRVLALLSDGRMLRVYEDAGRTAAELAPLSARDAKKFPEYRETLQQVGRAIAPLLIRTPPDIGDPSAADLLNLGKFGLKFRGLSRHNAYDLLRWAPMAVADFSAEWFETELLRAVIQARGIFGAFAGPRSAGTTIGLLLNAAFGPQQLVLGGMGELTHSLAKAAAGAGAEIRTLSKVRAIRVQSGEVAAVVLNDGEEVRARAVISNADLQHTLLKLIDPSHLDPAFLMNVRAFRAAGSVAKVNLAVSSLPSFAAVSERMHIGPDTDYLERAFDAAKYGEFSPEPVLSLTIPSLIDSSLAPQGKHVLSISAQYAPYRLKRGDWNSRREEFGDAVMKTLSSYAPDIGKLVLQRQVLTPLDIEEKFGLTGGHIFQGEHSLDQLFTFRPLLGWSRYRTPIKGLYMCGSGTHPGGGVTGAPGFNASREILKDL
jgi:phytoene dehydrogenase-like protein